MNAVRRAGLSEECERIYLTLVAHADGTGLVTQCSWTDIQDYASIVRPDIARSALQDLANAQFVRQEKRQMRKPIFQLLGRFLDDIEEAQVFLVRNQERVNGLRNGRTTSYSRVKSMRAGGDGHETIIENIKHLPPSALTKPHRWRFTVRILGFGVVTNCVYIEYTQKSPEIHGPSWRTRTNEDGTSEWIYPIEFDAELKQRIFESVRGIIESKKTAVN